MRDAQADSHSLDIAAHGLDKMHSNDHSVVAVDDAGVSVPQQQGSWQRAAQALYTAPGIGIVNSRVVPDSTRRAAHAAMQSKTAVSSHASHQSAEDQEEELEGLVQRLRQHGRIGHPTHTPARALHTVQDLPALKLSAKLAQASSLAQRERANGHHVLRGKRPKSQMSPVDLSRLKSIAAGRAHGMF
jgi:hypothetical protein